MSGKRFLIIGCGRQARAIAYHLAEAGAAQITLADKDASAAASLQDWLRQTGAYNKGVVRLAKEPFDAMGPIEQTSALMRGHDAVINAAGNAMNIRLSKAAIRARVSYCDIGHDDGIIAEQYELSPAARNAGVTLMPGCGIAPGGAQAATRHVIETFEREHGSMPESVEIRCGGIPLSRTFPVDYAAGFALSGLVVECKLPTKVLRDGKEVEEPSLDGIDGVGPFPDFGIGILEATATGGNAGTLTRTYAGRIKDMDYKTLRWPGHWAFIQMLDKHGLLGSKKLHGGGTASDATVEYLRKLIPDVSAANPDALVLRITATSSNPYRRVQFNMIDRFDAQTGLSAMERTTGFSAAIVAEMLATGEIAERGTLTQEGGIPTQAFMNAWKAAGLEYEISLIP